MTHSSKNTAFTMTLNIIYMLKIPKIISFHFQACISNCLRAISTWPSYKKTKHNLIKTEVFIFPTNHHLSYKSLFFSISK